MTSATNSVAFVHPEYVFVPETDLAADVRTAIGALMPAEWEQLFPGIRQRAACRLDPVARVVAFFSGRVVANQSIFDLRVDTPVFGLGDLVVDPQFRGRGIARGLITTTVDELRRRENAPLMTDSEIPTVRRVFLDLDFRVTPPGALLVEGHTASTMAGWLDWRPDGSAAPLRIRANC